MSLANFSSTYKIQKTEIKFMRDSRFSWRVRRCLLDCSAMWSGRKWHVSEVLTVSMSGGHWTSEMSVSFYQSTWHKKSHVHAIFTSSSLAYSCCRSLVFWRCVFEGRCWRFRETCCLHLRRHQKPTLLQHEYDRHENLKSDRVYSGFCNF